ncbi:MAG: hypothetical protein U5K54_18230 [Cytophagales bacterium]|nr:hypothetical protein [Cytophagales bacterium]
MARVSGTATRTPTVVRQYTSAPSCPSNPRTFPVTIFGQTVGGTTSGGGDICEGASAASITLAGENGTIQDWEVSVNGAAFLAAGLGTGSTINPGILAIVTSPSTTYDYRAEVANGPCSPAYSTVRRVTVWDSPVPAATGANQNSLRSLSFKSSGRQ